MNRPTCRRPTPPFLPLLLIVITAATPALRAAPAAWLKLETPEFVIYSDAPEKKITECALRYAAFRHVFATLFLKPGHTLPQSSLLLFNTSRSFDALLPDTGGGLYRTVHFSPEVDGLPVSAISLDGDLEHALDRTFEFETIWALKRLHQSIPLWMSQGAGDVLSTVVLDHGQCWGGAAPPHRLFSDQYAWPRFFKINVTADIYSNYFGKWEDALPCFLDQAWGVMHWILLSPGDTRDRVDRILQHLRTEPGLDAVTSVMAIPPAKLFRTANRHPKKARAFPFDEAAARASFHLSPAPEAEILVQTANLLYAVSEAPEPAGEVEKALRSAIPPPPSRAAEADAMVDRAHLLAPELACVKASWARRLLRENRPGEAVLLYREAIAAGSRNFAAYVFSAQARLDAGKSDGDRPGAGGAEAVQATRELRRALALKPGDAYCYRLLARSFYLSPQCTPADINELAAGITPDTEGAILRYFRGLLHDRLRQRDSALADLHAAFSDPAVPAAVRESAHQQYLRIAVGDDPAEIERLVHDRDYASALKIADAGCKNPEADIATVYRRFRSQLVQLVRRDPKATDAERKLAGLE